MKTRLKPRMIVDPTWNASDAAVEAMEARFQSLGERELFFPEKYSKRLPEGGAWIRVNCTLNTEYTVPPFSMWFATDWPMTPNDLGFAAARVKIKTPSGDLGVLPHEYCIVETISEWVGREHEGVFMRALDGRPVVDRETLNYLMSRGIPRGEAMLLMIDQIKSPDFAWFEIAPQYGAAFGCPWPHPDRCPFAKPEELWVAGSSLNTEN